MTPGFLALLCAALAGRAAAQTKQREAFAGLGRALQTQQWTVDTGDAGIHSKAAFSPDGTLTFIGSESGNLKAIYVSSGSTKWTYSADSGYPKGVTSPCVSSDGAVVFVGSVHSRLHAVLVTTGAAKWTYTSMSGNVYASPNLSPNGATVYMGSLGGTMYAFQASDGTMKWSKSGLGQVMSTAIASGSVIYFGAGSKVYALNAADGSTKWQKTVSGSIQASQAISPDGAYLYTATKAGKLIKHASADGVQAWQFSADGQLYSPSVSPDGSVVYAGTMAGTLYAVHASNGSPKWSKAMGGQIMVQPCPSSDGTTVFEAHEASPAKLVSHSAATGAINWQYSFHPSVDSHMYSSPVLSLDCTKVIVGSYDTKVHSVSSGLASGSCPPHSSTGSSSGSSIGGSPAPAGIITSGGSPAPAAAPAPAFADSSGSTRVACLVACLVALHLLALQEAVAG